MSAVLVTGGSGVIGNWVTRRLVEQGERVIIYGRRWDTTLIKDVADKVGFAAGDILDMPSIIQAIRSNGIERIIHMAAILPNQAEANPLMAFRINAEGALNIFEAARSTDIKRIVIPGTKAAYDIARGEHAHPIYKPIDEDYPMRPTDVYATTKLFAENMALNYNRIYGLDCVVLRFASTYGPGKLARHGGLAAVSKIIESAMLRRPLKIPQGRDQKEDFIYNRDVADGILLACFAEKLEHHVFHLGTGRAETLTRIVEILNGIFGEVPIEIGPGINFQGSPTARYLIYNFSRAERELGFSPKFDLQKGVADYIDMMQRLGITPLAPL